MQKMEFLFLDEKRAKCSQEKWINSSSRFKIYMKPDDSQTEENVSYTVWILWPQTTLFS